MSGTTTMNDMDRLRLEHCEIMLNGIQLALLKLMQANPNVQIEAVMAFEKCFLNSRTQIEKTNEAVIEDLKKRQ